jgi:hypothetical protein
MFKMNIKQTKQNKNPKSGLGCSSLVELLPSMLKALVLISSPAKISKQNITPPKKHC